MSLTYLSGIKTQALFVALLATMLTIPVTSFATYDQPTIGQVETVQTRYEDTLIDLAQAARVGYAQLIAANPNVDPWLPGKGRELVLPNWHILPDAPRKGLVLNTGELRLYYFPPDGSAPKTFPIGIGREGLSSPKGTSTVTRKQADPIWRPTPRMRLEDPELPAEVKPGPDNPLGAYALYMGWPSYLIHGTNKPKAIGRRASSGCIRMYDDEIEWLYHNVPVGTPIRSINQPIKMAWIEDEFFIEAEPNDLQIDEIEYQNRQITIDIPDGVIQSVRQKVGDQVHRIDWEKVRNVLIERNGIPTQVSVGKEIKITRHAREVERIKNKSLQKVVEKYKAKQAEVEKEPQDQKPAPAKIAPQQPKKDDWSDLNG